MTIEDGWLCDTGQLTIENEHLGSQNADLKAAGCPIKVATNAGFVCRCNILISKIEHLISVLLQNTDLQKQMAN